jgi:hypothetical protein
MPDVGQDTTQRVDPVCMFPLGTSVLRLLVPGVAVGVYIDRHSRADGVEVMCKVISRMPELFSEDERVEF